MTWEDYYDRYYDWEDSTRINRLSSLETLGPSDEVTEVMMDLTFEHEYAANRLAKKAIAQGMAFAAEDIEELACAIDGGLLEKLFIQSAGQFSSDELELLVGIIDDEVVAAEYKKKGYKLPSELAYLGDYDDTDADDDFAEFADEAVETGSGKRVGFFGRLAMAIAADSLASAGMRLISGQKAPRYGVGDRVRVRYRGQEGTIIDVTGDLYTVSLSDGLHVDTVHADQLEKP